MVGHKKRIPERPNFSEVKMGRRSLISYRVPVIVQQFKNNVIKGLDKLNKSLFPRYKAESNIDCP